MYHGPLIELGLHSGLTSGEQFCLAQSPLPNSSHYSHLPAKRCDIDTLVLCKDLRGPRFVISFACAQEGLAKEYKEHDALRP
jgi:hypothetical protein